MYCYVNLENPWFKRRWLFQLGHLLRVSPLGRMDNFQVLFSEGNPPIELGWNMIIVYYQYKKKKIAKTSIVTTAQKQWYLSSDQ